MELRSGLRICGAAGRASGDRIATPRRVRAPRSGASGRSGGPIADISPDLRVRSLCDGHRSSSTAPAPRPTRLDSTNLLYTTSTPPARLGRLRARRVAIRPALNLDFFTPARALAALCASCLRLCLCRYESCAESRSCAAPVNFIMALLPLLFTLQLRARHIDSSDTLAPLSHIPSPH